MEEITESLKEKNLIELTKFQIKCYKYSDALEDIMSYLFLNFSYSK